MSEKIIKEEKVEFKIAELFEKYWPPLPEEKFVILEKSILDEGLRENLVVWKEKNILLDGHQRLRVLKKHGIPYADKINYLSFPDEIHAKHWVHVTQSARRGDAPQFLSICHVMEFEPIYEEEGKMRMSAGGEKHGKVGSNGTDLQEKGRSRFFMARDSAASEHSVQRVLYIKAHDQEKFEELKKRAASGEDISIHLEHSKVLAAEDAKKAGVNLDRENLEKFDSSNTVRAFSDSVRKYKPPVHVQKSAGEAIVKNQQTADKNYIEDQIIHRLPKKQVKEKEKSGLARIKDKMAEIAAHLNKAVAEIRELRDLQSEYGDDLYFRSLAETPALRAAFSMFIIAAKSLQNGGKNEKKETAD